MKLTVVRKKIKKIYLRIKENGEVILTVPYNTRNKYIEQILEEKKLWIMEHLKQRIRNYETGDKIKFLGNTYFIKIYKNEKEKIELCGDYINIYIQDTQSFEKKELLLKKWYFENAEEKFKAIMEKYMDILNEKVEKVTIKEMNTRWGSCNYIKKRINLNLKLIEKPIECIEYVILHELAHLKHPNHSKEFYDYIYQYMEDHVERRKKLKLS